MKRGVFIIPYFGKLPYYFLLWMHTARYSKRFDFWIFTNDRSIVSNAPNVKIINQSFEEFTALVQSKFNFKIGLTTPRKLCDFKPTYGFIFEDQISQYDYWGFCDIDLLWGDIDNLVPLDKNYDKLYVHGHMTLLKNTPEINRLFMKSVQGYETYKSLLSAEDNHVFDEHSDGLNINLIAKQNGISTYFDYSMADINPFSYLFKIAKYDYSSVCKKGRKVIFPPKRKILFYWQKGKLTKFELYSDDNILCESVRYLHFQKRNLEIEDGANSATSFIIVPNKIIPYTGEIDSSLIKRLVKDKLIYTKYFELKFNSIKKRLHGKK